MIKKKVIRYKMMQVITIMNLILTFISVTIAVLTYLNRNEYLNEEITWSLQYYVEFAYPEKFADPESEEDMHVYEFYKPRGIIVNNSQIPITINSVTVYEKVNEEWQYKKGYFGREFFDNPKLDPGDLREWSMPLSVYFVCDYFYDDIIEYTNTHEYKLNKFEEFEEFDLFYDRGINEYLSKTPGIYTHTNLAIEFTTSKGKIIWIEDTKPSRTVDIKKILNDNAPIIILYIVLIIISKRRELKQKLKKGIRRITK